RDPHLTGTEDREHGLMPRQQTDLAHDGARDDLLRGAGPDLPVGRDDADGEFGHGQPFSFWMRSQLRSTSLMPPTLKNACSATESKSPRTIASNDSIVSLSGTVDPSTPVNLVAM